MGGLDVTSHNCCFFRWGQDCAIWDDDAEGDQYSRVEGDILADKGSQAIQDSTPGDGPRGIGVGKHFFTSSSEIKHSSSLVPVDSQLKLNGGAVVHKLAVGQGANFLHLILNWEVVQKLSNWFSCILANKVDVLFELLYSILLYQFIYQLDPYLVGGHLSK